MKTNNNGPSKPLTSEVSAPIFKPESLHFVKIDLESILEDIDSVWTETKDKDTQLALEMAKDHIEEVYNKLIEQREDISRRKAEKFAEEYREGASA